MKNIELRIGNYINGIYEIEIDRGNGIIEDVENLEVVKVVGLDGVGFSEYSIWVEDGSVEEYDSFEPIPLTEEWLLKLGAEIIETGFDMHEIICIMQYDRFKLIWKDAYKYWYVVDEISLTYLTKISDVHEWQNFVFIMNGKELKIT